MTSVSPPARDPRADPVRGALRARRARRQRRIRDWDLVTGKVYSSLRWHVILGRAGGLEPAVAEETGQIGALGEQVLRRALETLAGWREDGLIAEDVCMSVNLSGRQLDDPSWAEQVRAAINSAALPPSALKLEITESTLMEEVERTQAVFSEITDTGVGLHLDDFGTGYSSLTALHRFPVDALKLDRSFVATIDAPEESGGVIVRSTVALAHSLGLPVIAEGIKSVDQLRRLRSLGCEFGQGYLFSRALDAEATRALLENWSPEQALTLSETSV